MLHIFQILIDFIFPPNQEELEIRSLTPESFIKKATKVSDDALLSAHSVFSYKDPLVKELIWQIKYKKNKHAVKCAGLALYKWLCENNKDNCVLIPIPISKKRRKERGFNQCELLIDEIMRLDMENRFTKDYDTLIRLKDIEKQTLKNRKERIENTKNIFRVLKIQTDRKIIIIDDVTTTGSTLKEAGDALTQVGYKNIGSLTVAH